MATKKLKTLHPSSSEKESVSSGGTLEPNYSFGESCKVTTDKRKARIRDESPREKQKGVSKPTGVAVEAEQLPAPESPGTTVTEGGRDLSQSSSGPSTSKQENRSTTIYFKTSRAEFEAKYLHLEKLGEGGFGSVYAGIRKTDNLQQDLFLKKQKDDSNNAAISKPAEVSVEAVTAKGTKRKAGNEEEIFLKKQKGHSNNAAISKPAKAIPATETPSNKQRSGDNVTDTSTNTGEPTKASVETVKETGNKKEDSAEQLPAPESPGTTVTEGGHYLSQSSSGPSTSKQENRSTTIYFKTSRAEFEAKYLHLEKLGEGGFRSVYAGIRKTDNLPVAIKHIAKRDVTCQPVVLHGKIYNIPTEVLLMLQVAGGPRSVGKSSAVTLVDWYDLNQETLLVMERPVPSVDLLTYMLNNNGPMDENTAKNIMKQLVDAAIEMHSKGVFHRDIKSENILIETGSDVPRVRIIDFGCGCTVKMNLIEAFLEPLRMPLQSTSHVGHMKLPPPQSGSLALLFELLDGYNQVITSEFLHKNIIFDTGLSQDCQDLLNMCLALNPKERATLEQIQQHPWFS